MRGGEQDSQPCIRCLLLRQQPTLPFVDLETHPAYCQSRRPGSQHRLLKGTEDASLHAHLR